MRVALLLVAACWRQEPAKTPPSAPEPDSRTAYRTEPVRSDVTAPPVGPIFGGGRQPPAPPLAPVTPGMRIQGAVSCGPMPNASANGISLSAIDRSGNNIDLCARMDAALSKAPNIAAYQSHSYDVSAEVSTIAVANGDLTCKLSVAISATPSTRSGFANGAAKARLATASARDLALTTDVCVTAVIEDLLVRKVFP